MTPRRFAGAVVLLVALVLASVACGSDDEVAPSTSTSTTVASTDAPSTTTTAAPTTTTTAAPTTTTTTTTTTEPAAPEPVAVYWSWSIPTISAGTPERLGTGGRLAASPEEAVSALLEGPSALEAELGMTTNVPTSTSLLGLDVVAGEATIDLSADVEAPGGTLGETMRLAQLTFTLTQFADIDRVFVRVDGEERDSFGSHGIDVSDGLTRDDFADVRALITVEGPFPGDVVSDPFVIRGESNTFEAGVEWVLVDGDGLIIAEGFGTATAGNGIWGRFELDVDVPDGATGRGAIIVFDTSARDGSQENVVEYPIEFDPS